MGLYKVKIESGAFINDSLYRMDEIVQLEEGLDPLWGVKCDKDGNELEDHSEKIRKSEKINEHLAKSIEPDNKAMAALAKENAELKVGMDNMNEQIAKLTALVQQGADQIANNAPPPAPTQTGKAAMTQETIDQVDSAVQLLEDGNDEHWTQKGEPKLEALKEITGLELSRADVDGVNDRRREKPENKPS